MVAHHVGLEGGGRPIEAPFIGFTQQRVIVSPHVSRFSMWRIEKCSRQLYRWFGIGRRSTGTESAGWESQWQLFKKMQTV